MLQHPTSYRRTLITLMLLCPSFVQATPGDDAIAIITRAEQLYEGVDSRSQLTFRLQSKSGHDKRLSFVMLWKKYSAGPISEKTVLFQTYPPSRQGIAFMNWSYRDQARQDDAWLYLPELRSVRKVVHGNRHHHKSSADDFASSLLSQSQLRTRPLELDLLRRLDDERHGLAIHQRIERRPRKSQMDYPYSKVIESYEAGSGRLRQRDYYDRRGKHVLTLQVDWQQIGKAHVWRHVSASDLRSGLHSELDLEHTMVDQHFPERYFSKRQMRRGPP